MINTLCVYHPGVPTEIHRSFTMVRCASRQQRCGGSTGHRILLSTVSFWGQKHQSLSSLPHPVQKIYATRRNNMLPIRMNSTGSKRSFTYIVLRHAPVRASHNLSDWSREADTRVSPDGLIAHPNTQSLCPRSVSRSSPVCACPLLLNGLSRLACWHFPRSPS
jgi:hypothetical protein